MEVRMTPEEYRAAIATIGLSQLAAGRWLNVSPKTAQNYASKGPSGPAARAIMTEIKRRQLRAEVMQLGEMADVCVYGALDGDVCSYCQCGRLDPPA